MWTLAGVSWRCSRMRACSTRIRRRPDACTLSRVTITIRPAAPADATAIADIHNQGIIDRVATLDTTLRTVDTARAWLAERAARFPVIVAVVETERGEPTVVGWASLNRFNPRAAYDHVADFSVYVDRAWRGKGAGRQLLERLIALAREIGFHKMVLSALARNAAGIALYKRLGFERVGIYREMGMLDGEWVDVIIMEKILTQESRVPTRESSYNGGSQERV